MGQYYKVLTDNIKDGNCVWNIQTDEWKKEEKKPVDKRDWSLYTGVKLMEHSWIGNRFMNSISAYIYKNPTKVAWVGDYADDFEWGYTAENQPDPKDLWSCAWGEDTQSDCIKQLPFDYKGKYLCNHTKKTALSFDKYIELSERDGWIVHPLSLLTACGNGLGGGDYRDNGYNYEDVGFWCNDVISIEDEPGDCAVDDYYRFAEY